ncbi:MULTISPECIES: DNA-binding protein [unclassified Streptomyces]|uniref:DNA-binding protein n=1 Tax=unclassified Streptomyces TaxID=2593676 RepID=UPI002E35939F|nr:DNA-binding protein [Streptomyces sp. NBC_01278]
MEHVAALTAQLLETDRTVGARRAAPAALRAVASVASVASVDSDIAGRPHRRGTGAGAAERSALMELFQVAAWILFDAERHGTSRRLARRALALASTLPRESGSVELLVLSVLCLQEEHLGRPAESLRISSSVLAGEHPSARVAAIFHVREARARARLRQRRRALRSLAAARELLADGPSERDPSWTWWFDRSELDGHHGLALAALGDLDGAASLLYEATAARGAPAYRSLFPAELASVLARAGAWRETDTLLSSLVGSVPDIGSVRALNALARTARTIEGGPRVPRALRDASGHLGETLRKEGAR